MEKLTYRQAYDKIIDAYFKDEIKPLDCMFCFCGTLAPNGYWFHRLRREICIEPYSYSVDEYEKMERALFDGMYEVGIGRLSDTHDTRYETALFSGMTAALEVLKQIHRDRGEDVDEVPELAKRDLARTV